MTAQKVGEILAASGKLKTLSRAARRLAELERLLADAAPRALSEATRIKAFRAGILVVSADNPAVAAKLRQLVPRLLLQIRERDPEVTGIRIEAQPALDATRTPPPPRKRAIGSDALAGLQNLAESLADSPLKTALSRLVQGHKKDSGQP